ncbi:signal peptidase II [Aquibium sp. A9E412]|uniref:signal peptidase II n=1 Tax=Aquibium sp. A9E412 TaxID=2976767 RepID=UPI0025B04E0F|nr:signal peptidase II [Aquibium sp. A9E412]MDN2568133.1 signal peptidase II [Aquibium sp. A9E412]
MTARALTGYGAVAVAAVFADQAIKWLVEAGLPVHARLDLLPFLALYHTHNTGVAFSMFSGVGSTGLSLFVLAVILFISYLALRTDADQVFARFGFALIIGGAVGNLIDRAVRGYVVDYVLVFTPGWSFAIFNLADAFITVGAGLVILQELIALARERRRRRDR